MRTRFGRCLEHRHQLVVDVPVAHAVGERVESGADQTLRVLELEDVRGDPEPALVGLVDDGAVDLGGELLVLAVPRVDPDLDDVDLAGRELLDRLPAFRVARDPVRHRRAPRLGHRDPAPGAEKPGGAGHGLLAQIEHLVAVRAETQRGADAVVGAQLQVPHDRIPRRAEMRMGVDQHRHHGLPGQGHARGASRHANVRGRAGLRDPRAIDDQRRVLDHAPVAHDQPAALERGDGLRGRRSLEPGQDTHDEDRRDCDCVRSAHVSLPH